MPLVLSTKILNQAQKRHLFAAGIGLVEYNAVKIQALNPELKTQDFKNAIFTSQNAVRLAMAKNLSIKNAFCVGDKTAEMLEKQNIHIKQKANYAKDLAQLIIEKHPNQHFDFFCSQQRRDELPDILKQNNISLKEYHLYESVCNFKTFPNQFDAVLCFSPLGVKSYYEVHNARPLAICIGETTGEAARQFKAEVLVSNKTSVESVVVRVVKYFT